MCLLQRRTPPGPAAVQSYTRRRTVGRLPRSEPERKNGRCARQPARMSERPNAQESVAGGVTLLPGAEVEPHSCGLTESHTASEWATGPLRRLLFAPEISVNAS